MKYWELPESAFVDLVSFVYHCWPIWRQSSIQLKLLSLFSILCWCILLYISPCYVLLLTEMLSFARFTWKIPIFVSKSNFCSLAPPHLFWALARMWWSHLYMCLSTRGLVLSSGHSLGLPQGYTQMAGTQILSKCILCKWLSTAVCKWNLHYLQSFD